MSPSKKKFLIVFALFIAGLNLAIYIWTQSLKAEEIQYLKEKPVDWLTFDNEGRIWTFEDGEFKRNENNEYVLESGELKVYENGNLIHVYTEKDSPALRGQLREIAFDNIGRVWVAPKGPTRAINLAVFDGTKWSKLIPGGEVTALAIDAEGRAWAGVFKKGLYILEGGVWKIYTAENSDLINNHVSSITFDGEGRAWLTFRNGGVNIFDGKVWQTFNKSNSPLNSDEIMAFAFDKQGRAWMSHPDDTMSVFDGESWTIYNDIGSGRERSIVFDSQGRLWINTIYPTHMVKVLDGQTWKYFIDPYHSDVNFMTADKDGNIWVSTFDNGVVVVRPDWPQPISYIQAVLGFRLFSGLGAYITILLIVVWLATAFNEWNSIGIVLIGLPMYFVWVAMWNSIFAVDYFDELYLKLSNPAFFGTITGIIGGTVEILLKRSGKVKPVRWGLIGFLAGLIFMFFTMMAFIKAM